MAEANEGFIGKKCPKTFASIIIDFEAEIIIDTISSVHHTHRREEKRETDGRGVVKRKPLEFRKIDIWKNFLEICMEISSMG